MPETPLSALRQLTRAWVCKDPEEMERWLSEDVVELGPTFASAIVGRRSLLRQYRSYFDGETQIADYRIVRPRTVRLSPKLVLVYFHYTMRTMMRGIARESGGKESILIERQRGRWRVKFIHWHEDPRV